MCLQREPLENNVRKDKLLMSNTVFYEWPPVMFTINIYHEKGLLNMIWGSDCKQSDKDQAIFVCSLIFINTYYQSNNSS